MMKIISIISVMILCLCTLTLAGCTSLYESANGSEIEIEDEIESESEPVPGPEPEQKQEAEPRFGGIKGTAIISDELPFFIVLEDAFLSRTYDAELLIINLELTNTSDEYLDPNSVIYSIAAILDGSTLERGFLHNRSDFFIDSTVGIPVGASAKVQAGYKIKGELTGEINFLGIAYTITHDRQIEFINEKVDSSKIERRYSASDYKLTLDNAIKSDDGDGNDIIIVDMTFTNNSSEVISFLSATDIEIFQNGIALERGYLPYKHPAYDEKTDSNSRLDVKGGTTINVRRVFNLNDPGAPVEIKATDGGKFDAKPYFEKEIRLQ